MEALKTQKTLTNNKFHVKQRHSVNLPKNENYENENANCSDEEVNLFIRYMVDKSRRFKQLLQEKQVTNENKFYDKYLFKSICLKTVIKTAIDKMLYERRLGKNLKGMNKDNLSEIENNIWGSLLREIDLYKNEMEFYRDKEQLEATLAQHKQQILQQLEKLENRAKNSRPKSQRKQNLQ